MNAVWAPKVTQISNSRIMNHCRSTAKCRAIYSYMYSMFCMRGVSNGVGVATDGGLLCIETNGVNQSH